MTYYKVDCFGRDDGILGLHCFSTKKLTSLSSAFDYINNLPVPSSYEAFTIRKVSNDHVHIGSEYKKDMDILLNFD